MLVGGAIVDERDEAADTDQQTGGNEQRRDRIDAVSWPPTGAPRAAPSPMAIPAAPMFRPWPPSKSISMVIVRENAPMVIAPWTIRRRSTPSKGIEPTVGTAARAAYPSAPAIEPATINGVRRPVASLTRPQTPTNET